MPSSIEKPNSILVALFVALALTLSACGGSDGDTTPDGSEPPSANGDAADETDDPGGTSDDSVSSSGDLAGVALIVGEAQPLEKVALTGLPENVDTEQLQASFWPAEGDPLEEEFPLPLLVIEDGVYVVTPLYDVDGVDINLAVYAGEARSSTLSLNLNALPTAQDDGIEALVAGIDAGLDASLSALGMDYPDTLEYWRDQGFNQMPEYLVPLMQIWLMVLDPENDQAMAHRDYEPEERELIERVLSLRNLSPVLNAHAQVVADGDTLLNGIADTYGAQTFTTTALRRPPVAGDSVTSTSFVTGRNEIAGMLTIEGPEELSSAMQEFADARSLQRDMEIFDETVGAYITYIGLLGAIPSGGSSAAAGTGGREVVRRNGVKLLEFLSTGASAAGALGEMATWFYPCCITDVSVETSPGGGHIAYEDAEENQLAVTTVRVNVESRGVDVAREAFDRGFSQLQEAGGNLVDEDLWLGMGEEAEDWVRSEAQEALLDQLLDSELVFVWQGVDVMGNDPNDWLEYELDTFAAAGAPIIELASFPGSSHFEFRLVTPEAFEHQDTLLRIWPRIERFPQGGWSPIAQSTTSVMLEHIEAKLQPQVQTVDEVPKTVSFDVVVENALDTRAEIVDENGDVIAQLSHGDSFSVEVTDPPGDSGYELTYWVKSLSTDGIRGDSAAPERSGTGVIVVRPEDEEEDDEADEDYDPPPFGGCNTIGDWMTPERAEEAEEQYPSGYYFWPTSYQTGDPVLPELRGGAQAAIDHVSNEDIWTWFDVTVGAGSLSFVQKQTGVDGGIQLGDANFTLTQSGYQEKYFTLPDGAGAGMVEIWRYIFENASGVVIELEANTLGQLVDPSAPIQFDTPLIEGNNYACEFDLFDYW